jgi:Heparinase II/III-like protein
MTLFLPLDALRARKIALRDPLAIGGLASSLQRELHAALDVPVPDGKSRLTRYGGRCSRCTVLLTFDPRSPYSHTCPTCGTVYTDQVHHEWWLMNGHLWTAEQCTRAAALAVLLDDEKAAQRADDIIAAYASRYLTWPNRDNALGPTRPFFSTYLESIWLLHLTTALDLRIAANDGAYALAGNALERIVAPSAALIAGFDEGRSNRQVWHVAALLAASRLLDNAGMRDRAVSSLLALLESGLHSDGSWYEGENYHLFAHRGLLSGVTLAEQAGVVLPPALLQRFEAGFASPFRTMLPDGTFPARRDSQYGVALRQYRTADWVECGFARRDTPELRAALGSLYAAWPEAGETYRWSSSADAERNMPGVKLTRADCSWRALLLARTELPELTDAVPKSELLEGQGLAVFRHNSGKFWVGLDYGDPGDGHGHPDRLNLVIATPEARWLDDVGTGSYTSPTLSWYRSSMAHNAPMVNGKDQGAAHGQLLAHDSHDDAGLVSAEFIDPVSGVRFVRTVIVSDGDVIDIVDWSSDHHVVVDIPMQARVIDGGELEWAPFEPRTDRGDMLTKPYSAAIAAGTLHRLILEALPSPLIRSDARDKPSFICAVWSQGAANLWQAGTIGPPAGEAHGLVALRQRGRRGRSVRVIAASTFDSVVRENPVAATIEIVRADESTVVDRVQPWTWSIERRKNGVRRLTTLNGWRSESAGRGSARSMAQRSNQGSGENPAQREAVRIPVSRNPPGAFNIAVVALGELNYRPTDVSWLEASAPTAQVACKVGADDPTLTFLVSVRLNRPPFFAPARADNALDNEHADVNSDGVQFHWRSFVNGEWNSILAVPEGDEVRLSVVSGAADGIAAQWHLDTDNQGYQMSFEVLWPGLGTNIAYDCIINECPADRERRRGQLVLSGGRGEHAYLRGARQSPDHALHFVFDPVES